jgi:hypothetical protein
VTEADQLVAWSAFMLLVIAARLLVSRPALRFLGPRLSRLAEWWMARPRARSEADAELDELAAVQRRQQLSAHLQRLRRIVATDESMSATRQIANRIAYRGLLHDFEKTAELIPWLADDETAVRLIPTTYYSRPREVEVLEIGRRRQRDSG